jgi:hypothetical protein
MATLKSLKPDTDHEWRVTAGSTTVRGATFRTMTVHPVADPDLKVLLELVVAYRVAHESGDAKKARSAYIALGKAAQGLATKYGLPFD